MDILKGANLVLAFILELAALVAYGYWGWHTLQGFWPKLFFCIGLPVFVAVIWGVCFAPSSSMRFSEPWLSLGEIVVLLLSVFLLHQAHEDSWAILLGVAVIINMILALLWNQH